MPRSNSTSTYMIEKKSFKVVHYGVILGHRCPREILEGTRARPTKLDGPHSEGTCQI